MERASYASPRVGGYAGAKTGGVGSEMAVTPVGNDLRSVLARGVDCALMSAVSMNLDGLRSIPYSEMFVKTKIRDSCILFVKRCGVMWLQKAVYSLLEAFLNMPVFVAFWRGLGIV